MREDLHIALTQRIVGRCHNQSRMPLETVRFMLERAAAEVGTPAESKDNARMREQLERATGLGLAELAAALKALAGVKIPPEPRDRLAEQMGRMAREFGDPRESNPYVQHRKLGTDELVDMLIAAWYRGWDDAV